MHEARYLQKDFILADFRMILRFGIKSEAIDEYKNQT